MFNKFRVFFLSLTIVAIMMFSVYGTTTVYADDGTTTETTETNTPSPEESATPEAVEATAQPEETAVATEATIAPEETVDTPEATPQPEETEIATEATTSSEETAIATEATTPTEETALATEAASQPEEAVADTSDSPQPDLEGLPDNTTVTVINSEGEVQPLATQESADAIASTYDPIWCPEGQSPTPGENGCTNSFSSFNDLLIFLQANETDPAYQQAGTIYIQQGQYLGGESSVDFNNYSFNNLNQYNMTFQGGWDTTNNTVDPASTTQFDVPIIVGSSSNPWIGSLTFNNIWISGVTNGTGLTAYSESDINLSNVEITDSQSGAELNAGGNVVIENSIFNDNQDAGADIKAGSNVDVNNSHFDGNGGIEHPGHGLQVESGGNVTIADTSASFNEMFGANITADGVVNVTNSVFTGNIQYRYYSYTEGDRFAIGGYGLQVASLGDILLDGITADNNYSFGAHLTGAQIQVSNSSFNNNGTGRPEEAVGYGLQVESAGGLGVLLDNITANNNEKFGTNIEADGNVEVLNSFFNGNQSYTFDADGLSFQGYGLQVLTTGSIVLDAVEAVENTLFGANLDGGGTNISNSVFNNNGSGSSQFLVGSGLKN